MYTFSLSLSSVEGISVFDRDLYFCFVNDMFRYPFCLNIPLKIHQNRVSHSSDDRWS